MYHLKQFVVFIVMSVGLRCEDDLDCSVGRRFRAKSAAYYPSTQDASQGGLKDMEGKLLRTLQDYLRDEQTGRYVTVALAQTVPIPIGTPICIPEINRLYGQYIRFEFRDTGRDLRNTCFSKIRICTKDIQSAHHPVLNQYITVVVPEAAFSPN